MRRFTPLFVPLSILLLLLVAAPPVLGGVDWQAGKGYQTATPPLDLASTADGSHLFVLAEGGKVLIYDKEGTQVGTIPVDPAMDRITVDAKGERMTLSSRQLKRVQDYAIEFAVAINTDNSPFLGPPEAPVEVVVFSDFQCPYCSQVGPLLEFALEKNPETVKVVFKHFPLSFHKFAQAAALASIAAQEQGKFWQMHDLLFEHSKELSIEKINELARQAGLDMARFEEDVRSTETQQRLLRDLQDARQAGVRGTPTIFVNGRRLKNRSPQALQQMIEEEAAKARQAAAGSNQ